MKPVALSLTSSNGGPGENRLKLSACFSLPRLLAQRLCFQQAEERKQADQLAQERIDLQRSELNGQLSSQETIPPSKFSQVSTSVETASASGWHWRSADRSSAKLSACLKDDTTSKFSQVSTDVGGVKTDVDGVKTDVASAKTLIDQHSADLKRVTGDMGVMSGLIATNSKDLDGLRALGERNYYEFSLAKGQKSKADRKRHDR